MRSSANVLLLLLAACAGGDGRPVDGRPSYGDDRPQPPPTPSRQSGVDSAPLRPPELAQADAGYDAVGRALISDEVPRGALHRSLAPGSAAEVTAIDSGRTMLVRIDGPAAGPEEIVLSPAVAADLGVASRAPVRVRSALASPADAAALAARGGAVARMDAPAPLLAALRRKLGTAAQRPAVAARVRPARPGTAAIADAGGGRFRVQVAAGSSETRARQIAGSEGGSVEPAGALWRVRLGPFADAAAAGCPVTRASRRGYADAQIVSP